MNLRKSIGLKKKKKETPKTWKEYINWDEMTCLKLDENGTPYFLDKTLEERIQKELSSFSEL